MIKKHASHTQTTRSTNTLFFLYGSGDNYFNLILPAIALYFSQNLHALKVIFIYYYALITVLQFIPGILVRHLGFRWSMITYILVFIFGTVVGLFYNGDTHWLFISRLSQAFGFSVLPFFTKAITYQLPKEALTSSIMQRNLVKNLSGPVLVAIFGIIIQYQSWRICYLAIGLIYLIALIWLSFFFNDINVKGLTPIKVQIKSMHHFIFQTLLPHSDLALTFIANTLITTTTAFLLLSYAFLFHGEFGLTIIVVGIIPLIYSLCGMSASLVLTLQKKTHGSNTHIILFSTTAAIVITFLLLVLIYFSLASWEVILIAFSMTYFFLTVLTLYISVQFGLITKNTGRNIEYNMLYYVSKNFFPLLIVIVWSFFKQDSLTIPCIIFILTFTIGILLILAAKKAQLIK